MKKYIIFSILCIIALQSTAQDKLELEDVKVLKVFKAKMDNAKLLLVEQAIPKVEKTKKEYNYNVSSTQLVLDYPAPIIKPIGLKKETPIEGNDGYIKLGAGYPKAFYGDLGYNLHYDELYDFNLRVNYFSLNSEKKIVEHKFGQWGVLLDGKYHINQRHTINASAGINKENAYLFSNRTVDSLRKDKREIYRTDFKFRWGNDQFDENAFTYYAGASLSTISLKDQDASETSFPLIAGANYEINDHLSVELGAKVKLNFLDNNIDSELHSFGINPQVLYKRNKYSVTAGLDVIGNNQEEYLVFPNADIKVELYKKYIILHGGIKNQHYENNLNNLLSYNPYIKTDSLTINGNYQKKFFVDLNGSVSNFNYIIEGGYQIDHNKALYNFNVSDTDLAYILNDSLNTTYIKMAISYNLANKLTVGTSNTFNIYQLNNHQEAYGLPTTEHKIYGLYKALDNKLRLGTSIDFKTGLYKLDIADDFDTPSKYEEVLYDINLTAEYDFMKNIGAFLNLDNITNNSQERWWGYQQAPFSIVGGVKVKF